MQFESRNPATGQLLQLVNGTVGGELETRLDHAQRAFPLWSSLKVAQRAERLRQLKQVITSHREQVAKLITLEMGKLAREALAEVDKCALLCDYYLENSEAYLHPETIVSDAARSYLLYQPLGTVLAIMPWNFPLWQVMRCAIPAVTSGNVCLLKHAANVPQLALYIERIFSEAGYAPGVFTTLLIPSAQVAEIIRDRRVHAVSFTGSEAAGRQVAACAGAALKKCVLELGGSDPFVVLDDADLTAAAQTAITSRFLNCGQSCIAAKRFIIQTGIADEFTARLQSALEQLQTGDPLLDATSLAPMARSDLRAQLHTQVQSSISQGAIALLGARLPEAAGYFYPATLLDQVNTANTAARQELFGPVLALMRAGSEAEALTLANDTAYGLGASVWTQDPDKAAYWSEQLQAGMVFINGLVKSDPRLPFGGIKNSGYGRELSRYGQLEFVNIKTVWQNL